MTAGETKRPIGDLLRLLSPSLGEEKAAEVVSEAARALGLGAAPVSQKQALSILERIATTTTGLVGITARFAKCQLLLRWDSAL